MTATAPVAPPPRWRGLLWVAAGNLTGAIATFCYFSFIDLYGRDETAGIVRPVTLYFVVGFSLLGAAGIALGFRWAAPIDAPSPDVDDPVVRRRALALPWAMAGISAIGWMMASVVWGVVLPALIGTLSWSRFLRTLVGTTLIGGSVTVVFTFLAVEHAWRRQLPRYFPRGDLGAVPGIPRLRVRTRLLAIFLLISVLPMALMAMLTWGRAHRMIDAEHAVATALLHNMVVAIVFLLGVGIATAIGLARRSRRTVPGRQQRRDRRRGGGLQPHGRWPARARAHP